MDKKLAGAPRKFSYKGKKKNTTIRLTDDEKKLILEKFNSLGEFIQKCISDLSK